MRLSWVTTTTVLPCRRERSRRISVTWRPFSASSAAVGSSARITGGCPANARAMATRWRCPPERSIGFRSTLSPRPTCSSSARASTLAARVGTPRSSSCRATFCPAVSEAMRLSPWKMKPM